MGKSGKDSHANAQHIGNVIQQLLKSYHIKTKFDEANVVSSWERLVGKSIAKRTKKVSVRNQVLFVEMMSPSMKNDLNFHKNDIIEIFQKEFGEGSIKEIVIM